MSGDRWYLDTSGAVKLVLDEEHARALRAWVASREQALVSSDLLRTELVRVGLRLPEPVARDLRRLVERLTILRLDVPAFEAAGTLQPTTLRSLEALHLAAAQMLGPDLAGIVTYDERLADAARRLEIPVATPR